MAKFCLCEKAKQFFQRKDNNCVLLLFCILSIMLMCCCIIQQIAEYRCKYTQLNVQYEQRLDRCEELLEELNGKIGIMGEENEQ